MTLAFFAGIGFAELIFILLPILLFGVLWVWALVDILRSRFADSTQQVIWLLVVILIPFLGTILYFAIGRSSKRSVNQ